MERVISATEARVHFGELLRRVADEGETVLVERGGKPRVVVLSVPAYDRLRHNPNPYADTQAELARVHAMVLADLNGREIDVDALFDEMREERDEHLIAHLR